MSTRGALRTSADEVSSSAPARLSRTDTAAEVGPYRGGLRGRHGDAEELAHPLVRSAAVGLDPRIDELRGELVPERVDGRSLVRVDQLVAGVNVPVIAPPAAMICAWSALTWRSRPGIVEDHGGVVG